MSSWRLRAPAASAIAATALIVAGCGGGVTGVAPPPCPSPSDMGCVSGTVGVSVAAASAGSRTLQPAVSRDIQRQPSGAPPFVRNQLLVKFKPAAAPARVTEALRQFGTREVKRLGGVGVSVLEITTGESVSSVVGRYRSHPLVQYAEPNYYRYLLGSPSSPSARLQATPNDPFYPNQWHYAKINLPAAWDVTTGSSLVVVAVIDSGILGSHPDLSGITVTGFDFYGNDPNPADDGCASPTDLSHGSHVAGTIAAATNNGVGVAGVNWGGPGKTKIMPLRIFGNVGPGICSATTDDVVAAIIYAADHSARVINMSFGAYGFSQAEQDAVNYAVSTGVTLVAAAGNDNLDCSNFYPAGYANVIGASATDVLDAKAWYSNFGSCVDVAAPGGDTRDTVDLNMDGFPDGVLSTSGTPATPNQYWFFQGTSMAAPHVAGLAALLISKGVTGPANVQNVIETTAVPLGPPGYDTTFGWGRINAADAVGATGANPMRAFSGDIGGNIITKRSDTVAVASNGTYLITNAQPGTRTVFAWQDTNGSGTIDGGDLYGSISGVVINAGSTTGGVNVPVSEVPAGTPPITF